MGDTKTETVPAGKVHYRGDFMGYEIDIEASPAYVQSLISDGIPLTAVSPAEERPKKQPRVSFMGGEDTDPDAVAEGITKIFGIPSD